MYYSLECYKCFITDVVERNNNFVISFLPLKMSAGSSYNNISIGVISFAKGGLLSINSVFFIIFLLLLLLVQLMVIFVSDKSGSIADLSPKRNFRMPRKRNKNGNGL